MKLRSELWLRIGGRERAHTRGWGSRRTRGGIAPRKSAWHLRAELSMDGYAVGRMAMEKRCRERTGALAWHVWLRNGPKRCRSANLTYEGTNT